ncbi:hypothetical protein PRUPE_3G135300 [Prunus persica]|uniref:Uncharacterized protein n=1 Tax=Prunus persica TaxID=3760 RepID=A0A251PZQ8_PRUPE|nr:hypothetical protein PRUPE_3G135300 [Prunus persica]
MNTNPILHISFTTSSKAVLLHTDRSRRGLSWTTFFFVNCFDAFSLVPWKALAYCAMNSTSSKAVRSKCKLLESSSPSVGPRSPPSNSSDGFVTFGTSPVP